MSEYISREAVFDWFCESADIGGCVGLSRNNGSCKKGCRYCTSGKELDEILAAEVQPVVHGKWINDHNGRYSPLGDNFFCSVCKEPSLRAYGKPAKTHFCPNCGALMDKDGADND